MSLEEIEELQEKLETKDVAQKRYLMYRMFEQVLEEVYDEVPEPEQRVKQLQEGNGYLYKLAQDFLTESSTMKKEEKLQKMVEYIE
jgi:DNA-binding transcriptional MerR regulator